jgi:hypothetical protein
MPPAFWQFLISILLALVALIQALHPPAFLLR